MIQETNYNITLIKDTLFDHKRQIEKLSNSVSENFMLIQQQFSQTMEEEQSIKKPLLDKIRQVEEEYRSIMREYNRTAAFNRQLVGDYMTLKNEPSPDRNSTAPTNYFDLGETEPPSRRSRVTTTKGRERMFNSSLDDIQP